MSSSWVCWNKWTKCNCVSDNHLHNQSIIFTTVGYPSMRCEVCSEVAMRDYCWYNTALLMSQRRHLIAISWDWRISWPPWGLLPGLCNTCNIRKYVQVFCSSINPTSLLLDVSQWFLPCNPWERAHSLQKKLMSKFEFSRNKHKLGEAYLTIICSVLNWFFELFLNFACHTTVL